MPFFTPVALTVPLHEHDMMWETVAPLGFESMKYTYANGMPKRYIVPAGYRTDLASVPRVPIVYWLVGGRGAAAAVLHDFLYDHGRRLRMIEDRSESDDVYFEALVSTGVRAQWAHAMWLGVRAGGLGRFRDGGPSEVNA